MSWPKLKVCAADRLMAKILKRVCVWLYLHLTFICKAQKSILIKENHPQMPTVHLQWLFFTKFTTDGFSETLSVYFRFSLSSWCCIMRDQFPIVIKQPAIGSRWGWFWRCCFICLTRAQFTCGAFAINFPRMCTTPHHHRWNSTFKFNRKITKTKLFCIKSNEFLQIMFSALHNAICERVWCV